MLKLSEYTLAWLYISESFILKTRQSQVKGQHLEFSGQSSSEAPGLGVIGQRESGVRRLTSCHTNTWGAYN